jgi:ElaB/YqjD/DUF883 family membrane-anchored ribosome-binding protein
MNISKTASKVEDEISERFHDASERLGELKAEAAKSLGKRIDALSALVNDHPIAALGVSVALGYLIARLVHRGS